MPPPGNAPGDSRIQTGGVFGGQVSQALGHEQDRPGAAAQTGGGRGRPHDLLGLRRPSSVRANRRNSLATA